MSGWNFCGSLVGSQGVSAGQRSHRDYPAVNGIHCASDSCEAPKISARSRSRELRPSSWDLVRAFFDRFSASQRAMARTSENLIPQPREPQTTALRRCCAKTYSHMSTTSFVAMLFADFAMTILVSLASSSPGQELRGQPADWPFWQS